MMKQAPANTKFAKVYFLWHRFGTKYVIFGVCEIKSVNRHSMISDGAVSS